MNLIFFKLTRLGILCLQASLILSVFVDRGLRIVIFFVILIFFCTLLSQYADLMVPYTFLLPITSMKTLFPCYQFQGKYDWKKRYLPPSFRN